MGDIPDWFWQGLVANVFTEGLMLAAFLAWKYRSKLHEHYVFMLVLLTGILASVTIPYRYDELESPTDNDTDVEAQREAVRHFIPVQNIDLFPPFRAGFNVDALAQFRGNFYTDAFAQVRSSMRDNFKVNQYAAELVRSSNMYSVSEAVRNSLKMNQDTSLLARTAEEIRKSFVTNYDRSLLTRTAEEVRKSFIANHDMGVLARTAEEVRRSFNTDPFAELRESLKLNPFER